MIFCLRQLQEKYIEQDRPLYMVFVDFSKAFDTVGRTGLWQLLKKYGCPEKFTTMIEALHTGMMATVNVGGEVSESFRVTNGVKQGCVLALVLVRYQVLFDTDRYLNFVRYSILTLQVVHREHSSQ